jgi:autotransporter-associated beta strand protein
MAGVSSLTLGKGASLTVNNDVKSSFSEVYAEIGGVKKKLAAGDYTYPDERVPQLKAGGFTVVGSSAISSATWTGGGGADTSIANTDNWDDDGVDFSTGLLSAMFATGGNAATVSSNVKFQNMTLQAAEGEAGFTFAKGSNDGTVTLTGTSLDVTDTDSTNRTYAFDVPLAVEGAQTLTVSLPAKKALAMNEGVSVPDGALQFTGAGTVRLSGESAISGAMSIESGMTAYLTGLLDTPGGVDQGLASVDGARTFTVNGGSTADSDWKGLVLTNATVRKPLAIRGNSSNSQKYLLHTMAGTTNEISGNLYFSVGYGRNNIKLRRNSELTCSGGMRVGKSTVCIDGDAGSRLVFTEKPVTSTVDYVYNASTYYFGLGIYYGHVVFDVCRNAITYLRPGLYNSANHATTLEFLRSDMFSSTDTTLAAGMYNSGSALRPLSVEAFQTVEFHATTQRFARVLSGKTATFNGGEGSLLEVYGAQVPDDGDAPHVTETNLYVAAKFTGGLSLKMGGTGTLILTNAVSSTSGGIEVTNGTVKIASNAAWTNASYIAVGGTGRLEIDAATGLGRLETFPETAALSLSGEGVISIPDGDELRLGSLSVDGSRFSCGRFTYATAPAALKAHLAETTGSIVVRRTGTLFLLQ